MAGPGRNEPCPCGSDIKYKKCCIVKERDIGVQSPNKRLASGKAIAKAMGMALKELSEEATDEFVAQCVWSDYLDAEQLGRLNLNEKTRPHVEKTLQVMSAWYALLPGGGNGLSKCLGRFRHRFTEAERGYLEAGMRGIAGFFQVREVDPERDRALLENIVTSEVYPVQDRDLSHHCPPGVIFSGLVAENAEGDFRLHPMSNINLMPELKGRLREMLQAELHHYNEELEEENSPPLRDVSALIKECPHIVFQLVAWAIHTQISGPQEIRNMDGHDLVFHEIRYRVKNLHSLQPVLKAIATKSHEESEGLQVHTWENEKEYLTHRFELREQAAEATLSCNSDERLTHWESNILPKLPGLEEIDRSRRTLEQVRADGKLAVP